MGCAVCKARGTVLASPRILEQDPKNDGASRSSTCVATRRTGNGLVESPICLTDGLDDSRVAAPLTDHDDKQISCIKPEKFLISSPAPLPTETSHAIRDNGSSERGSCPSELDQVSAHVSASEPGGTSLSYQKEANSTERGEIVVADGASTGPQKRKAVPVRDAPAQHSANPTNGKLTCCNRTDEPPNCKELVNSTRTVTFQGAAVTQMELRSRFSTQRTKEVSCPSNIDTWTKMAFDAYAQSDVDFSDELLGKVQTLYSQLMATGAEQRPRPGYADFSRTTAVSDCPCTTTGRQIEDLSMKLQSFQQKTGRQQALEAVNLPPEHASSVSALLPLTG
ncbi:hypothetical protein TGME49_248350 [Toxoplasma gondii ME49]|uniref:Uncharacterized protein n=5 Tax=Toxoplasma gondii TaxID=5811 RepID=A0A125YSE7_TOXGV|nr:hypothetical protein TGME49_248350 [Toxoplasma gondii ME49]EPT25000.1 hypothetical protein TGME49_248350 [Toxoplasma gondii ME49]ESS34293.1 hypothetical protein TGVEG_248350 [Toxoplasma gondii VEG]KYF49702.1 hypothetical protein TGARI_248350 [Toxoplasma gondii ARI]PIM04584.1 hypothetical protein TGCOUG_248350 [Toxoplasma gondii COUG]|eukprot:XP_002367182.2 hypothetical protein TGME49_248350 [Toxoplasma gondii ME49]